MHLYGHEKISALLGMIGKADHIETVGGKQKEVLRVLMPGDVCLMDTTTTDYNGRVCLVKSPGEAKEVYQRIFIDGDTAIVCDPTDGEENDRCPLEDLKVYGVVTGIVRSLEAEERPDMEAWDEFCAKYPTDKLMNYYYYDWKYAKAIKQHERGGAYGCFSWGYKYGFAEGRRAEKGAARRKRRAEKKRDSKEMR